MIAMHWLIRVGMAVVAVPAAQEQPTTAPETARQIAACEGQKFEFKAGDETRPTKITLCSKKDANKDDLVRMLDSAATKIQEIDKLPPDRKAALVAQIKAKIIEIQALQDVAPLPTVAPILPKPLPPPAPIFTKPLPAPAPILTKPRLTIQCFTPGELGVGGPCVSLERDTLLTVRADENLAGGTSLRFLRKGDVRGQIALAQMRKGQSVRVKLPQQLCAGVVGSRVEIQILNGRAGGAGANQVVDSLGPYPLRC